MTTPYRHDSLDLKVPSFPLLYLQPGEDDESIACKLIVSRLDEHRNFIARSYTWGDPTVRKPILIDGDTLDVTANLHDALKMLRPSPGSKVKPILDDLSWFEDYFWRTLLANVDLDGNYPASDVYGIDLGLMRSWTASSQASSRIPTSTRTEPKSETISVQQNSAALKVNHFLPHLPPNYLPELPPTEECEKLEVLVTRACKLALQGRRFSITEQGLMGLGRPSLRKDDLICLIIGGDTPFMLREDSTTSHNSLGNRSRFVRLIGPAYVYTTMGGEGADALKNGAPLNQLEMI